MAGGVGSEGWRGEMTPYLHTCGRCHSSVTCGQTQNMLL